MMQEHSLRNAWTLRAGVVLVLAIQTGSTALSQTSSASSQISITPASKQSVTTGSHDLVYRSRSGSGPVCSTGAKPNQRRPGDISARSTVGVAYASTWADIDRHRRHRVDSGMGRPGARDAQRRCYLDSRRCEALARSNTEDVCDAHRDPGSGKRLRRLVVGTSNGRTVQTKQVDTNKKC